MSDLFGGHEDAVMAATFLCRSDVSPSQKKRHVGQAKGAELSCCCFGIEGAGPGPDFLDVCVKN